MATPTITEHQTRSDRHTTHYLACGPADGTPVIFLHGWPDLALGWRHQLLALGALGFRALAPDMRGYGQSTVHPAKTDYALEACVADMLELLASTGREAAVWVGHDLGAPVAWAIASHHPERTLAVAALCVPYMPQGMSPPKLVELVDRSVYPITEFPVGQWDYQLHYLENFDHAVAELGANPVNTVKAMFRAGSPAHAGKPSPTALLRKRGGWFGKAGAAPDLPLDRSVMSNDELRHYADALARNGFAGPNSWYTNGERNDAYMQASVNGGRLAMPALFIHASYDAICETLKSPLAGPMRAHCARLTELTVDAGHWAAQEQSERVNAGLARWLANDLARAWRC